MSRRQKEDLRRIIAATITFIAVVLLPVEGIVKAVLFLIPYFIVGYDVVWGAVRNIFHGAIFDENFLMTLATIGAFAIGEYPEAVFVMLFFQVGELFQSVAVGKSRKSISALMDICPESAVVLREGEFCEVFPEEVRVGDILLIKPGEKIPVDGVIVKGETDIDTSNMTGESLPRNVKTGDRVISGCVNLSGVIEVEAKCEYNDSTVAKVLELVENSAMNKGKYENFITRFARVYTPVVVVLALLVAFVPPVFDKNLTVWVMRALSFLVVSCPCALVISVPLSFFGGIGAASRKGVLIKGSTYLEVLSKCRYVATDKTGTLTEGKLKVDSFDSEEALKLAASIEKFSNHPVARAITERAESFYEAENTCEIPGKGMKGIVNEKSVLIGNSLLMAEAGITVEGAGIFVACDGKYMGRITVSDKVKEGAKDAIKKLYEVGVKDIAMLTGDEEKGAVKVGIEAGIEKIHHSLLPADKVKRLEEIIEKADGSVVYIGDGINDAPCLKRADVGIAMGDLGSDAAIESSDVVFMNGDLSLLAESVKIARKTIAIVKQNIVFSIGVKVGVLMLTALGYADMWQAVFADVGVMVIAVLNTLRTLKM